MEPPKAKKAAPGGAAFHVLMTRVCGPTLNNAECDGSARDDGRGPPSGRDRTCKARKR
ncbi:hypothetical protein BVI2075_960077 [Burkholderia vietnamiensis]|nr:hypothetical protein BVI2075_960077 [Burkholderia vietnamiensis]